MKKLFLTLLFCLFTANCFGAELLVRVKPHWMDSFTQTEVNKLTPEAKQSYESRSQIGDIVVVRPDGWKWGKEECLPNFVVVKVPQLTEAEAKKYEESLYDNIKPEKPILLRHRKYALPKIDIQAIKTDSVILTKTAINNKLITKTGLATEISAPKNDLISYLKYLWNGPQFDIPDKIYPRMLVETIFPDAYAATQLLKTVKPSGGDYTSLEACMNANEQNLVTADKYFDVEIDGSWTSADTTAVTIHNYTTNATRFINIYTTVAARHDGKWKTSAYILDITRNTDDTRVINIIGDMIKISGLQIDMDGTGGYITAISYDTLTYEYNGGRFYNNIIKWTGSSAGYNGLTGIGGFAGIGAWNNIIYNFKNDGNGWGIESSNLASTSVFENNTIYNCNIGFRGGIAKVVNNIANACDDGFSGTFGAGSNYNASDIASDAPGANSRNGADGDVTFVSASDFHLAAADVNAKDRGTSSVSNNFTDDIDGVTRTGTWDIGADEYVAVAAPRRRVIIIDSKNEKTNSNHGVFVRGNYRDISILCLHPHNAAKRI